MLKKELVNWLDTFNNVTVPNLIAKGFKPTPVNAREGLANLTKGLISNIPEIATIFDDYICNADYNVPVRIYNPNPSEKLPVLIYFHGGGHMAGSVTVYDPICKKLAIKTNHIVVSVEYRLSPENPYPCGLVDAYNSIKYIYNTLDSRNINYIRSLKIGGDSGGGAIVASVAMLAQFDDTVVIDKMFMIYPSLDYTMSFPSIVSNGKGYLLESGKILWYFNNYFAHDEDRRKASPIFNEITENIPPTLIFTASYCPLRDEGVEYVSKLKDAKVNVLHFNLDNMIHTFMNMEDLCQEECNFVYEKINLFLNS